jgi:hypothetical protein
MAYCGDCRYFSPIHHGVRFVTGACTVPFPDNSSMLVPECFINSEPDKRYLVADKSNLRRKYFNSNGQPRFRDCSGFSSRRRTISDSSPPSALDWKSTV